MEYFTYKKAERCKYIIVLLTVVNKEYIGLSKEKFYKLKSQSHELIEIYNFIVCMSQGKYLTPVGYSDINQWLQQEKRILDTCKGIKNTSEQYHWKDIYKMFNGEFEDLEDIKKAVVEIFNRLEMPHSRDIYQNLNRKGKQAILK